MNVGFLEIQYSFCLQQSAVNLGQSMNMLGAANRTHIPPAEFGLVPMTGLFDSAYIVLWVDKHMEWAFLGEENLTFFYRALFLQHLPFIISIQ